MDGFFTFIMNFVCVFSVVFTHLSIYLFFKFPSFDMLQITKKLKKHTTFFVLSTQVVHTVSIRAPQVLQMVDFNIELDFLLSYVIVKNTNVKLVRNRLKI